MPTTVDAVYLRAPSGLLRLLVADVFLLLSFLGTVNVWRGIWNALDLWLLPDNRELSCWITHIGCFLLLVLLNCGNTILVRGVYIDAEEEEGQCVVFPCHYLRLFFKVCTISSSSSSSVVISHHTGVCFCLFFFVRFIFTEIILNQINYLNSQFTQLFKYSLPFNYFNYCVLSNVTTPLFISCQIEREKKRARQRKLLVASQDLVGCTEVNEKDGENGTLLPNTTISIIPANTDSLAT